MIILGIDPGLADTGYGAVKIEGNNIEYLTSGVIKTSKEKELAWRLREIRDDYIELLVHIQPDEVAIEELFFWKNVKTCISVAMARGVILASSAHVPISEYTPMQAKNIACGSGKATKKDMQNIVNKLFKLTIADDNAADALALAVGHARIRMNVQPFPLKEKRHVS